MWRTISTGVRGLGLKRLFILVEFWDSKTESAGNCGCDSDCCRWSWFWESLCTTDADEAPREGAGFDTQLPILANYDCQKSSSRWESGIESKGFLLLLCRRCIVRMDHIFGLYKHEIWLWKIKGEILPILFNLSSSHFLFFHFPPFDYCNCFHGPIRIWKMLQIDRPKRESHFVFIKINKAKYTFDPYWLR